jgi:hypothetical protein
VVLASMKSGSSGTRTVTVTHTATGEFVVERDRYVDG